MTKLNDDKVCCANCGAEAEGVDAADICNNCRKPWVYICVKGGFVTSVLANRPDTVIEVFDLDNEIDPDSQAKFWERLKTDGDGVSQLWEQY